MRVRRGLPRVSKGPKFVLQDQLGTPWWTDQSPKRAQSMENMATFEIEHFFSIRTRELCVNWKNAQFRNYQYYLGNITVCEGPLPSWWPQEATLVARRCLRGTTVLSRGQNRLPQSSQNNCCCGQQKVKINLQNHASRCRGVEKYKKTCLQRTAGF